MSPEPIVGGDPVAECGWPSVVALLSSTTSCTGTLVGPSLVMYAAHCGDDFSVARFGETVDGSGLARAVPIDHCRVHPEGTIGGGQDVAWCRLAQPVDDVPIVPVLAGCEAEILTPGYPITHVGFGRTETGSSGEKRVVGTTIVGISEAGELHTGGGGADTCQGDSGGPAFVQLDDGSWRVAGITSWGGPCGEGGYSTLVPSVTDWIESGSGIDITPCHTQGGDWGPSAACGGFPLQPGRGDGDWATACGGAVSGPSEACGAPFEPGTDASCEGHCGGGSPSGCFCDSSCWAFGDCCDDYVTVCEPSAECRGYYCGTWAPAGCWCDAGCTAKGDCCPDYDATC